MKSTVLILRIAAVLGLTGILAGAFGAHALEARLSPESLEVYHTAVRYQMMHALALLGLVGLTIAVGSEQAACSSKRIAMFWIVGVLLFSGSLYFLALGIGPKKIWGPLTPLGGLCQMIGWFLLLVSVARYGRAEMDA